MTARAQPKMFFEIGPDEERGFVYTSGINALHPSKVEFISLGVTRDDQNNVGMTIDFLAGRLMSGHDVRPYQNAESNGVKYAILPLGDDLKGALLEKYATDCDEGVNLLLLMPRSMLPFALPANATESGEENVVGEKAIMIHTIREKWSTAPIRHINGITTDNRLANLAYVSFYDAFTHPEWQVDWVCELEEDEIAFVRENMGIFAEIYKSSGTA
mmetsp:Transcript_41791/g.75227  ORF Transcript_41791/g.75227 Transcript_41791/m.75227 type:complete len:215 (-) Transcript_41791:112-756(-)|eukprot:CAMPEP_0201882608 /NCGR_PEP_ID=MMETSP0902-20130614/14304_1 /ASSEMBLY_ACC=CAM_ASM_000551 /TAXON_ID=420261 /ORGANISM="Thalassiosira antarctica, Strain CCMP982" /LENGTH=214 /DNA_ID=CAMNT_0048411185 /DNA_START=135 /DNA_END=779 /DNA_ORIENTATION=+